MEREKAIVINFFNELLDLYEFELWIDVNSNLDNVFRLNDRQGANWSGIEQDEFYTLADVIERLSSPHEDYIYRSLEKRKEANENISKYDWDLTVKRYLESDTVAKILSEIYVKDYTKIVSKKEKFEIKDILEILNKDEEFYKSVCQKYINTMSKEMLLETSDKIFRIYIEDKYIDIKENGDINIDNYEQYLDEEFEVEEYNFYNDLYNFDIKNNIANDLNELELFDENDEWVFYITFEELKKIGYGFMVKDHYPLLEKYAIPEDEKFDFYNYFTLEQLDDFENSLYKYFVEESIVYEESNVLTLKSMSDFEEKESCSFNIDILRLACGMITYKDFIDDYITKESEKYVNIISKVTEYFREHDLEKLKDYGSDNDEGLYHFTDFYKDILDKLDIKYVHIGTEEKEPGEYTTNINFDDNNTIVVDTKEGEEVDYLISNLTFISNEYDLWIEEKLKEKVNNEIDLEVGI